MVDSETPQEAPAAVAPAAGSGQGGPGATLRAAREASGQGPADIARVLCLELRLVEAIEDDRYEAFGAAVFARGHVRRYAQALELDVDTVLRSWDERFASAPPPAVPDPKVAPVAERSGGIPAPLVVVLLLLVLAGGAAFVWWWLHPPGPGASASQVPVAAPPAAVVRQREAAAATDSASSAAVSRVPDPAPPEPAQAEASALVAEPDEGRVVDAQDPVGGLTDPVPVTLPSVSEAPVQAAPAAQGGTQAPAPVQTAPVDTAQALADAGPAPVGTGSDVAVRFIFDDACWVSVRDAEGKTLMLGLREPGTVNDRLGVPPISVTLGRYPGVRIEVDGEPFEVPASAIDGAIARFEIPAP